MFSERGNAPWSLLGFLSQRNLDGRTVVFSEVMCTEEGERLREFTVYLVATYKVREKRCDWLLSNEIPNKMLGDIFPTTYLVSMDPFRQRSFF